MGFLETGCLLGSRRAAVQLDCLVSGQDGWVGTGCCPCPKQVPEMASGDRETQQVLTSHVCKCVCVCVCVCVCESVPTCAGLHRGCLRV